MANRFKTISYVYAHLFDLIHDAVNDNPGIRTTVFFKSCSLSYACCHKKKKKIFSSITNNVLPVWIGHHPI